MEEKELDVKSVKSLLTEMLDKQNRMDLKLNEIDKTLIQLNNAVAGNPIYGQTGMIAELREVQKYVHKDKMGKSKIMGGLVVVGVLWTMIWEFVKHKIFNNQ